MTSKELAEELVVAKKFIERCFKHVGRSQLITCMGEHNVAMAEELLKRISDD